MTLLNRRIRHERKLEIGVDEAVEFGDVVEAASEDEGVEGDGDSRGTVSRTTIGRRLEKESLEVRHTTVLRKGVSTITLRWLK